MGVQNKIQDLNNHLFAQLEKLQDDDIELAKEIERSKGICAIADRLIDSFKAQSNYAKMQMENRGGKVIIPALEPDVKLISGANE